MEVNHINNTLATAKRRPRPLNRGGRWIEVSNTTVYWQINRDFGKWPLNGGWPLNRWPLNRGRTVLQHFQGKDIAMSRHVRSPHTNHKCTYRSRPISRHLGYTNLANKAFIQLNWDLRKELWHTVYTPNRQDACSPTCSLGEPVAMHSLVHLSCLLSQK